MASQNADPADLVHLSFDATRTYTGRYRHQFYRNHADEIAGRVLDVGAGSGDTNDRFDGLADADEYIAVDIEFAASLDVQADAGQLPFATDSFDTVLLSAVLEHIPVSRVLDVVNEAQRVLRPGGTLLAGVPHNYPLHSEPNDYWRPTIYGLRDVLQTAGFDEIETYRGGSYSETLLHGLFYPFRAVLMFLGVRELAWLFAPVHYVVCLVASMLATTLRAVYGENPFGSRWYLQSFVVARVQG